MKCIPKDMIRVVVNKRRPKSLRMLLERNKAIGAYVSKDVAMVEKAQQKKF